MSLTAQELGNLANAAIEYYLKGAPEAQTLQDRPLYNRLMKTKKTFPGGKDVIRGNVKGDYSTSFMGYSYDDVVSYVNPANIKQFEYAWKELHAGIALTHSELKRDGISVVSTNGERTSEHNDREMTAISGLLDDKIDDMMEGSARSFNNICWGDGTSSSKIFPGIQGMVTVNPNTGLVAGLDAGTQTWWRNRAFVGSLSSTTNTGPKTTASAANQTLTKLLRKEVRQLRRYGGRPTLLLCGSGFIEKLELEVSEKGYYTNEGFTNEGKTDIGLARISLLGAGTFEYDPTLDDLGFNNFCWMLDPRHIYLMAMEGEENKTHSPERPPAQYVMYRGITWTGCLIMRKRNCHGVYEAA